MVKHIIGVYISCSSTHGCTTFQEIVLAPVNSNGEFRNINVS